MTQMFVETFGDYFHIKKIPNSLAATWNGGEPNCGVSVFQWDCGLILQKYSLKSGDTLGMSL